MKGWKNMKLTKRIAAAFLAMSLTVGTMSVYAASATTPGYKLVNTYDEDAGIITSDIYVTDGYGAVGQLGLYYDTELLDLGAVIDKNITTDYAVDDIKMANIAVAATGEKYTVTATAETNKLANLINEDDGEVFFAWYSGATSNVDARNEDKKILTVTFVVADDVDAADLEKAGSSLITFAKDKPSNSSVKGYSSGVYCANEENTAFRNSANAKNRITLSVEFVGLEIEEEKKSIIIKITDSNGKAVEGAIVKIGSQEAVTNSNGEVEFEISGDSYTVYYKYSKDDDFVALEDGTTAVISAPGKVKTPSVSTGTEKLTVSWTKPETNGANIEKYIVSYTKAGGNEQTKEVDGNTTTLVLKDLTGGSKYTIKVKAVNAFGEGEYSDEKTATPSKTTGGGTGTGSGTSGTGGGTTTPSVTNYTVTYDVGANGTITAGSKTESVAKGGYPSKLPTVTAKEGYKFIGWAKVGGTVIDPTTIQITAATTFVAQYEKLEQSGTGTSVTNPFADLNEKDWFYTSVITAYSRGLMNGVSTTEFNPNGDVTRAMFVTVLYRMEGSPENDGNKKFGDVEVGSWYDKAVAWASANGIVNGVSDTEFAPNNKITREQMAAMVYRYASYKKADMTVTKDLSSYTDLASVSEYALEPMKWVCGMGIINGMTETTLVPQGTSTRAQAATVFVRTQDNLAK